LNLGDAASRVVLITASSQGIGRAIATYLGRKSWTVVLLARSKPVLDLARSLGGIAAQGSVTVAADLERLVEAALSHCGRIGADVHNTGHPAKGDLFGLGDEVWQDGFELILGSVIRLARLTTPILTRQGRGAFVNVSSYAAKKPELERAVSSVFRAALSSWTRLHAEYCAPSGVRVNSVMPGFVNSYPIDSKTAAAIPMGRIGRLEELAATVAFLLSDEASYVTGQNILVDGGMVGSM
jgi:NAD(P)-dependent dehydrogenase (short-subunit alcohol dehydrogenase family)